MEFHEVGLSINCVRNKAFTDIEQIIETFIDTITLILYMIFLHSFILLAIYSSLGIEIVLKSSFSIRYLYDTLIYDILSFLIFYISKNFSKSIST